MKRPTRYSVMLSEQERQELEATADALGIEASDVVRMQIREGYRRRFGSAGATKTAEAK